MNWILGCFLGFVILCLIANRTQSKRQREALVSLFTKQCGQKNTRTLSARELEMINAYSDFRKEDSGLDKITWTDLQLDRIFRSLAYTQSSMGDEILYWYLRFPRMEQEELEKREKIISYFQHNPEKRLQMQLLFHRVGRSKQYSLVQYLEKCEGFQGISVLPHILGDTALIISIVLLFIQLPIGLLCCFFSLLYNLLTYFKTKGELDLYAGSIGYVFRTIESGKKVVSLLPEEFQTDKEAIDKILDSLTFFHPLWLWLVGGEGMKGDFFSVLLDYVRMFTHVDLFLGFLLVKQMQDSKQDLYRLIETMGQYDACIAIGLYRQSVEFYCIPDFSDTNNKQIENAYHPLLEHPVANSVPLGQSILLTGSNASGKSTFLKTLGVNMVLSQSIHTCLAKSYQMPLVSVFTSLAVQDSLEKGESYYIAEIKAILRMFQMDTEGVQKVCILDEVLRGTNTIERVAAASQILKSMSEDNILCIAATHDLELTELLKDHWKQYHFEESIVEKEIQFSYEIKEGKANTRNAIALLEQMGYGKDIVESARELAKNFEEKGLYFS